MKTILMAAVSMVLMTGVAQAKTVASEKTKVKVARVTQLLPLVQKPDLQVSLVVEDLGGSTDVSPTEKMYLTLYSKGEMFSTDAAFEIDSALFVKSAKRVSGGVYEVSFQTYNEKGMQELTYEIDARKAITDMKNVRCNDEFDCAASENFKSTIELRLK